jgi:hypothetical protein
MGILSPFKPDKKKKRQRNGAIGKKWVRFAAG